jgi:hypothetical protein
MEISGSSETLGGVSDLKVRTQTYDTIKLVLV